jgi:hypothetical protein
VVVAAVGVDLAGASPRPATPATDRWDRVQQRQQLGDVVAVAAGQDHRQGDAGGVGDQVVLAAQPAPVDRAGTGEVPPFSARRCEESTTVCAGPARQPSAAQPASSRAAHSGHQRGHRMILGQPTRTWQLARRTPVRNRCNRRRRPRPRIGSRVGVRPPWPPSRPCRSRSGPVADTSGHFRCGRPLYRPDSRHRGRPAVSAVRPGRGGCYRNRSLGRRPLVGCSQRRCTRASRVVRRPRSWPRT